MYARVYGNMPVLVRRASHKIPIVSHAWRCANTIARNVWQFGCVAQAANVRPRCWLPSPAPTPTTTTMPTSNHASTMHDADDERASSCDNIVKFIDSVLAAFYIRDKLVFRRNEIVGGNMHTMPKSRSEDLRVCASWNTRKTHDKDAGNGARKKLFAQGWCCVCWRVVRSRCLAHGDVIL